MLDQEIAALFAAHPDQHIFASLPRSGTVRAASLLAEIGDCPGGRLTVITRYPSWHEVWLCSNSNI